MCVCVCVCKYEYEYFLFFCTETPARSDNTARDNLMTATQRLTEAEGAGVVLGGNRSQWGRVGGGTKATSCTLIGR